MLNTQVLLSCSFETCRLLSVERRIVRQLLSEGRLESLGSVQNTLCPQDRFINFFLINRELKVRNYKS